MPMEPISSSGLRPIRSTKIIAITVPMTFTIEVVKEYRNELVGSMPTDCHSDEE